MNVPLTSALRSEGSDPAKPLSFPPTPRATLFLSYGCAPLLVCLLGWSAQGCFDKIHPVPVLATDSMTPLRLAASSTIPC